MNSLKSICIVFLIMVQGCRVLAQEQSTPLPQKLNLEQCIEIALEQNADARNAEINTSLTKIDHSEAKANLLPSISGGASHSFNYGRNINPVTNVYENFTTSAGGYSLGASLLLFNGLNNLRAIRRQAFAYKAAQFTEQSVKDNLTMDVILAYLQVMNSQDVLKQNEQRLNVTLKQLDRTKVLLDEGNTKPDEYYDLQGQAEGEKADILTTKNTLVSNKVNLFRLLNMPYDENATFEEINVQAYNENENIDDKQLYELASNSLGTIKAGTYSRQSALYNYKAAKSLYFPSFSLEGGQNSNYLVQDNNTIGGQLRNNIGRYIGFSMRIPITGTIFTRQNVSRAKLALKSAEIDLENAKNGLHQATIEVLNNLKTAKERYINIKQQSDAYRESFRIAQLRFELGDINSVEFLQQKNKLDNANISLVIAGYEWILRQRIADYYAGKR
ncbi:TolC family protein [Olivibacter sitiensis]|uniref:TolC family protein n=1 Tax=Olivibacter sitiensis TaxID=376470 RepID=UPI00041FA99E|nr:TolC family protein [Olivibacter sitiensis]